jgi:hypothetical protein
LVVPRSIPMIFAICVYPKICPIPGWMKLYLGAKARGFKYFPERAPR